MRESGEIKMTDTEWEDIVVALRDSNADIAASAAARLQKKASAPALPRLVALLDDEDSFLREAAAWPISELAGLSYVRELLIAYQRGFDDGYDNDGFSTALIDLVEMNPSESKSILQHIAKDENPVLRQNAIWLLGFCSPK
jgi:HEAT repeat protein